MVSDDFGQSIKGMHIEGDTIVSTDRQPGIFGKSNDPTPVYKFLTLDASSGDLLVNFSNTTIGVTGTGIGVDTNFEYAVDTAAGASDVGAMILAVRDDALTTLIPVDGDYVQLRTNSTGALWVAGNLTITASNSVYKADSKTAVKDTPITIVTETPASATESFTAIMVSGAGQCEWKVWFGATGSEATILHFWTTPSHPTEYVDLPDFLDVTTAQTIYIQATNREKAASTGSDFTAMATLIRKA